MSHRAREISQDSRDARPEKRSIPTDSFPGLSRSLPVSRWVMGTILCVTKAALSSPRPLVLWDSVAVGQSGHSTPQQRGCYCTLQHFGLPCIFSDSHIFTMGFAVTSQQMWIICPRYGLCWTALRGSSGPFGSPPDLTPFTLDKHNTKEKRKFYVRGWVITCRKKDSLIPLGV